MFGPSTLLPNIRCGRHAPPRRRANTILFRNIYTPLPVSICPSSRSVFARQPCAKTRANASGNIPQHAHGLSQANIGLDIGSMVDPINTLSGSGYWGRSVTPLPPPTATTVASPLPAGFGSVPAVKVCKVHKFCTINDHQTGDN